MTDYTSLKRCSKCGVEYPSTPEYFKRDRRISCGLCAQCKNCDRVYRQANKEYISQKRKRHYQKNREHERETNRRYHDANRAEILERQAKYRKTEAFKQSKRKHQYRPDVYARELERQRAYNARKRTKGEGLTRLEWFRAIEYFNGCCAVCGRQLHDLFGEHTVSADHWIPFSKGGSSNADNMVPLCHGIDGCNNSKKDNMPHRWLVRKFGKRKAAEIEVRINAYFEWVKEQTEAA